MTTFHAKLKNLNACGASLEWVGKRSIARAYRECERGDWMMWLATKVGVDRKLVVHAACACVRLSLPRVPAGETRPLAAIETAERWCRGEATINEVRTAADAASAAHAAAHAAYAAVHAAYAAVHAAAYAATCAVTYAADAASSASVAKKQTLRECADLVRKTIPLAVFKQAMRGAG